MCYKRGIKEVLSAPYVRNGRLWNEKDCYLELEGNMWDTFELVVFTVILGHSFHLSQNGIST